MYEVYKTEILDLYTKKRMKNIFVHINKNIKKNNVPFGLSY